MFAYEETDLEDCSHCQGTGIPTYGPVEGNCPYCKGSGVIRYNIDEDDYADYMYDQMKDARLEEDYYDDE